MRKRTVSVLLLSPVLLLVFIYGMLISPLGGPILSLIANHAIANLKITAIEGSFADALSISQLNWQNDQWRVSADEAYLDATWRCLFEPRACVKDIRITNLTVTQLSEAPEGAPSTADDNSLTLPVPISIEEASVEQFSLILPTQTLELASFSLKGFQGNDSINIASLSLSDLTVRLLEDTNKPQPVPSTSSLPQSYSLSYTAPQLPTIVSPIAVNVDVFSLENATLQQGETTETLPRLAFEDFTFTQASLQLANLELIHQHGELRGNAGITFDDTYSLDIVLNGNTLVESAAQTVRFAATGSLADLNAEIHAEGPINALANLSVDMLNDTLPITFSATWREQPLPTIDNATLHGGQLSLTGTMGDYLLTGEAAATLPEIGKIPVALNVILKEHNVYVTEAKIEALEGSISNTGTLYLNEAISWQGNTQFVNVSAQQFSPYAPEQLQGGFVSIMQWSEKGPHISIRDLNLVGTLRQQPFSVNGSLVYSGPSDLMVAQLDVDQGDNNINLVGQLFNNRHINAVVDLDVASIANLYPDVSGGVSGTIKATGPWRNPNAKGTVSLSNVIVSPALSNEIAQQGAINGSISVDGAYTHHKVDVDLSLPDHQLALLLEGAWQDPVWTGQIQESNLKLANMQWTLSSPFTLTVGSTPFSAKVSEHCWLSRAEGELCVTSLDYQADHARWNLWAKALPVGLWAHELAPDKIAEASAATLSLQSSGQYTPQAPIDVTFNASLTPATWRFGKERPLAITINAVETTGTLKQGELKSTSLITSDDLGKATLSFNTKPFEDERPLDGSVSITNIDVSPLKPLSPAIRELSGLLNGDITLAGYIDEPEITGDLHIENGAIDIQDSPVSLENWEQKISLHGDYADFEGAFILGGGNGTLQGDVSWSGAPSANIALKGEKFEVRQPNMRLRVSPDLRIEATSEKVEVTGNVNIPWARIEIESLPQSAVSPSKDVHLRGEPPKNEPLDVVHASVMVNIDKAKTADVKIEAFGLTGALQGGIRVNTQPALVGFGDLQVLNGRYSAYGQQLVIQTGELQFNGPIDQPLLLIEAIRDPSKTDDDVIAGIRIDGAADAPSINLFSEPAMDQQNVLSYLLTGQGPDAESEDPNYAALLLGFGLSNTKTLTGQVGKVLGIDEFSLSTNEDKLSVTGQINDRLTAIYNVDVGLSNNDSSSTLLRRQDPPDLALRYRLLPRLFLEALQTTIEDQSEFALDLYYEFFLGEGKDDDTATPKAANSEKLDN